MHREFTKNSYSSHNLPYFIVYFNRFSVHFSAIHTQNRMIARSKVVEVTTFHPRGTTQTTIVPPLHVPLPSRSLYGQILVYIWS